MRCSAKTHKHFVSYTRRPKGICGVLEVTEDFAVHCLDNLGYKKPLDTYHFMQNLKSMGHYPTFPASTKRKAQQAYPRRIT